MAKIKIRKKKLFEDDAQVTQQVQQAQQQVTQQNQQLQQPQLNQQLQQLPQLNQQLQQQPQLNQQLQQSQQNQYTEKISNILKKMENVYWMISVNIPEEIQKELPDFKQGNTMADPIIKLWGDFKNNPNENTFNTFLDSFKTFGETPQQNNANNQQQQAVNAGLKAAYSFNKKLLENLDIAKQLKYLINAINEIDSYFNKNDI